MRSRQQLWLSFQEQKENIDPEKGRQNGEAKDKEKSKKDLGKACKDFANAEGNRIFSEFGINNSRLFKLIYMDMQVRNDVTLAFKKNKFAAAPI